ncbi:Putative sensor hybrid histidine kinase with PAS domain [Cupriavidus taiwanensis]|uniref:hybrid sensor histidine kinase/response regulator n=1 Tax=Cupriavidus taiwanensis TaxID=164546 RepID=UPI000E14B9B0|nr:ATP-binding protein [Cupriavidus taiwanensis]SOY93173.1 Putative sensor hybrid histidine kinase with PAS domain [Cupriavidus taiwanensis]SOY96580.1 Putative sensor hybrid histidine kinase with PAS domain [Cupriavidus taiwanensis]
MTGMQAATEVRSTLVESCGGLAPEGDALHLAQRYRRLLDAVEDCAVFELDAHGVIVAWPEPARRLFGYSAAEIVGSHVSRLHRAEDAAAGLAQQWLDAAARSGQARDEGWRVRRDGSLLRASCDMRCMDAADLPDGAAGTGFIVSCRDTTVQQAAADHARLAADKLHLLAENLPCTAVCELSLDGTIRSWNAGAHALAGHTAEEAAGRPLAWLYTRQDAAAGRPQAALEAARACGQWAGEERLARKDGSVMRCATRMVLVRDAAGCPECLLWTARDLSDALRLEMLDAGNRRLQSFLAILAHELRNPLAPVRNAVEVIVLTPDTGPRVRRCAEIIERQLRQVERLVNDLLDVGRVTAGKLKMELTPTSYNEVVATSLEAIRPTLEASGQQLVVALPEVSPFVRADAARLGQVLLNLLSNAAKYTPRGGTVSVQVSVEAERVITAVSDTGRGLERAALDRIFNLFTQESDAGSRSGLGIGLALAKAILEAHGGAIQADSAGAGKGSTFTVILPRASARPAEPATLAPGRAPCRRVLVVDDNADSADSMAELLTLLGHEAQAVHSGQQAVGVAAAFRPDCVLLDLQMPDMSGYEVLEALREDLRGRPVRFLALSGRGTAEDQRRSRQAGFDAHLTKPLSIEALSRALAEPVPARPAGPHKER